jgi:UDP:flavonoid glycosyltransferase YjiC (YdhE family)
MAKILFIPMEYGIAHTGRLLMVAKELSKLKHEIVFSAGPLTKTLLKSENIRYEILPEISKEALTKLQNLKTNFYSVNTIEHFVDSELELYNRLQPDAVVSDLRATVKISTKIAKIPHITVNNANVTKYYDYSQAKFPVPTFFLSEFIPAYLVQQLERKWINHNIVSRLGPPLVNTLLAEQFVKFNFVLGKHRKKPIRSFYDFLEGDLSLISDASFYRPLKKLPQHVKQVGPIFWQPEIKLPPWQKKVIDHKKNGGKVVYVTLGGTGDKSVFEQVLNNLSDFPALFVATTGNVAKPSQIDTPLNCIITNYLPGDWIDSYSDAIIFFGGNLTAYQALANGVPQLVLPLHVDQQDNANQLNRLGTGITLNPYKLSKKVLIQNLSLILYDKIYKEKTAKYQMLLKKLNGPKKAAKEINSFLHTI